MFLLAEGGIILLLFDPTLPFSFELVCTFTGKDVHCLIFCVSFVRCDTVGKVVDVRLRKGGCK